MNRKKSSAFSLLELTVTAAEISILTFVAIPYAHEFYTTRQKQQVYSTLKTMRDALVQYSKDHNGSYPRKLAGLVELGYLREVPVNILTGEKDWQIARREFTLITVEVTYGLVRDFNKKSELWVKCTNPFFASNGWADYRFCLPRNSTGEVFSDPPVTPGAPLYSSFRGICNIRSSLSLGFDPDENAYGTVEIYATSSNYNL
ncbi:MAG: type II secretion system protein [Candidatus Wallbacteria bacterium]|nr:type II secretion system protein [Candidatus Wallbacteria bacterium]